MKPFSLLHYYSVCYFFPLVSHILATWDETLPKQEARHLKHTADFREDIFFEVSELVFMFAKAEQEVLQILIYFRHRGAEWACDVTAERAKLKRPRIQGADVVKQGPCGPLLHDQLQFSWTSDKI